MVSSYQMRLLKRLLFLLVPYSLLRVCFYFYHLNLYSDFKTSEILYGFLIGVRFDVAAIILVNIPVVFLSSVQIFNEKFLKFERFVFIFLNTCAFLMAIIDFELFNFMGKRLSFDLFVILGDILDQLPQLLINFWFFPLISLSLGILFYFVDRKYFLINEESPKKFSIVSFFLLIPLLFIGVRGGLQHKSINVQSAFIQGKNELGHLVLNSPYHFFRTLKNDPVRKINYFTSDDLARDIIRKYRKPIDQFRGEKKSNVVLIILESFSMEYIEQGYTPFLTELKSRGLFFNRHLANGRRSIESLPSLLCGLPSLLKEPISKSFFSGNKFSCFPDALKDRGYSNLFYHAGARGTMGFDSYTLAHGFNKYFSREDFGSDHFDGTWGVFDLPFMQYVSQSLTQVEGPFTAAIFTLSSHQPYKIPKEFEGKFPKGDLEIHESIGYADFSLKKFFESAQKQDWFKNTYFIITADHTQKLQTAKYSNMVGRYRVPLIILGPGIKPGVSNKITQHSDIPMTVMDLLDVEEKLPMTSVSVLAGDEGSAINFADGATYFLATNKRVLTLDTESSYDWETGATGPMTSSQDPILKAYLQYFINGLLNNNLSP